MMKIGLDVGSTTLKCVILDKDENIVFSTYKRHFSKISQMTGELLSEIAGKFPGEKMQIVVSGSAGMGMATDLGLSFVQEVYATRNAVRKLSPESDVVIELGGEDAKILFITGGLEVRMNGTCAGGTGAFIDRMASLLSVDTPALNELAKEREKIYTIASRCGVCAKCKTGLHKSFVVAFNTAGVIELVEFSCKFFNVVSNLSRVISLCGGNYFVRIVC